MLTMLFGFLAGGFLAFLYDLYEKRKDREADIIFEEIQNRKLDELIANRTERELLTPMDPAFFWSLIDGTRVRSKGNIEHQKGLLRDHLHHCAANELIAFDNRYIHLVQQALTHKLYAAVVLIFQRPLTHTGFLNFIDWAICQGEAVFNNICHNPDFLAHKDVEAGAEEAIHILDMVREVYYSTTKTLMPEVDDSTFELLDDELTQEDISVQFPTLWKNFSKQTDAEEQE